MSLSFLKNHGVRNGGPDGNSAEWTWHTLATLKSMDEKAVVALADNVSDYEKRSGESASAHANRIKGRFRGATINMLIHYEAFARSRARLQSKRMPENGALGARFSTWAKCFLSRVLPLRIKATMVAMKRDEGTRVKNPKPDGLAIQGTTDA